jgi:hypothetical protein
LPPAGRGLAPAPVLWIVRLRPFADVMRCCSVASVAEIYMPLLKEGTDAWRPINVTPLQGGVYMVEGPMPDGETWLFTPGTVIQIKWKKFADGQSRLIPKGSEPTNSSIVNDHFQSSVGVLIGASPLLVAMNWLPRQADGSLESAPLLLTTVALVLVAGYLLIWHKPNALVFKSAAWSALGFGILFSLLEL